MSVDPAQIELTDEQKRRVAELAERTGLPWADILSEALRHWRPQNGFPATDQPTDATFYDAMKDVIGIMKDAPPDLSCRE